MPKVTLRVINGQPIFQDRDVLDTLNDGWYDVMNRMLGEKFGIHVPFPSKETM